MRNKTRKKIKRLRLLRHESLDVCVWCKEADSGPCYCHVIYYNGRNNSTEERLEDAPVGSIVIVGELDE